MNKIPRLLGLLHGTIGAVSSFFLTPVLVIYSLVSSIYKVKIRARTWVILPAIGFSSICLLGSITSFHANFYIYTEILAFIMIPVLFRTHNSIRFIVNVQFLFILSVTILGIISTAVTLSQYDSVIDMKSRSETWMWPFVIYGGLNGLLYAYGLLLPIFVFFLNSRHKKVGIFILLSIPFWMLNIVSGWHGKGIIVSYILGLLFILAFKFRVIFSILFCGGLYVLTTLGIDYAGLYDLLFLNARGAEYVGLMSGADSEATSVESLYIRLYGLYGLPALVYAVGIVGCCLSIGLRSYLVSSINNTDAWLFVYFLFSLFATSFVTSNLFLFYVPSVFLAWSFYFYMIDYRHDQTMSERTSLT